MDCPDAWGEPDFEGFPYPITESCTAALPVASMFRWSETSRILTLERGNHQPVILLLSGEVIRRSNIQSDVATGVRSPVLPTPTFYGSHALAWEPVALPLSRLI